MAKRDEDSELEQPMIPTDELRELLADCEDARRDGETVLASTLRVQFAHSRLGYRAPSLAAEVLRLREMEEARR